MKKIIIFNACSFIYGAERGLINLIKALKDKFEITVVLPRKGPLERKLRNFPMEINIKIFSLPVLMFSLSPFYYIRFVFLSIINFIYFTFYIMHKDIDIICTNSLLLTFPGMVAKLTKKRHIWYVREFFSSNILNLTSGWFIKNFPDEIICQSGTIKNKLFLNNKAAVIYEPLDFHDYKIYDPNIVKREFNLPMNSTIITIISRIHPLKGQYEFIKKIVEILKEDKNLFLIIAGDISPPTLKNRLYKKRIEKLIERNNLKNVLLLGFREDIDKILSFSDICVFPFRREEPFGIAVTEALAFGRLTFFPKNAGLKEIYEIFKEGEDFNLRRFREAISIFKDTTSKRLEKLYIPDILSFKSYKDKVLSVFEG